MTPEEMGKALGAGWLWQAGWRGAPGSWQWFPNGPEWGGVEVEDADDGIDGWTVSLHDDDGNMATIPAMGSARAVAVAHLLVAAERIAAGAQVADELDWYCATCDGKHDGFLSSHRGPPFDNNRPASARRFALDLLRAADEAEAQP